MKAKRNETKYTTNFNWKESTILLLLQWIQKDEELQENKQHHGRTHARTSMEYHIVVSRPKSELDRPSQERSESLNTTRILAH
jgi:hypothetical protein